MTESYTWVNSDIVVCNHCAAFGHKPQDVRHRQTCCRVHGQCLCFVEVVDIPHSDVVRDIGRLEKVRHMLWHAVETNLSWGENKWKDAYRAGIKSYELLWYIQEWNREHDDGSK